MLFVTDDKVHAIYLLRGGEYVLVMTPVSAQVFRVSTGERVAWRAWVSLTDEERVVSPETVVYREHAWSNNYHMHFDATTLKLSIHVQHGPTYSRWSPRVLLNGGRAMYDHETGTCAKIHASINYVSSVLDETRIIGGFIGEMRVCIIEYRTGAKLYELPGSARRLDYTQIFYSPDIDEMWCDGRVTRVSSTLRRGRVRTGDSKLLIWSPDGERERDRVDVVVAETGETLYSFRCAESVRVVRFTGKALAFTTSANRFEVHRIDSKFERDVLILTASSRWRRFFDTDGDHALVSIIAAFF